MSKYQELAKALWPEASDVRGDGRFAAVHSCDGTTTVELHQTARAAMASGGPQRHELVLDE
ncbi:hypothetical protein [Modestobacter sp. SSW1-42]|uniref:hypothetical protein n=1 Tax=Modestobacter sp. SSW1-42 TaxID=596372 RepID=UPI0039861C2F